MIKNPDVIITAGGTKEAIDDVRYIGNFSSGRFGHSIAETYASHGHQVTLVSPYSLPQRFGKIEGVDYQHFTSAEDLKRILLGYDAAKLIFQSAAIADYSPQKISGKISSNEENLTVELIRNPKILELLRGHYGEDTTLVGFKLLSKVPCKQLIDIASQQIAKNQTDYSVANLLEDISPESGHRKIHTLNKRGEIFDIEGPTPEVARQLYRIIDWEDRL